MSVSYSEVSPGALMLSRSCTLEFCDLCRSVTASRPRSPSVILRALLPPSPSGGGPLPFHLEGLMLRGTRPTANLSNHCPDRAYCALLPPCGHVSFLKQPPRPLELILALRPLTVFT